MTGDVFLSNEEYLQQQDIIKARQQRIIQVNRIYYACNSVDLT